MIKDPATAWLEEALDDLDARGLRRGLRVIEPVDGPLVRVDGKQVINFSSNDYLGLSSSPELTGAALEALGHLGVGAPSARLIAGNRLAHRSLEQDIAHFKKTEAALLFPSGYQANAGTIAALVGEGDVVFSDELNHASIIDGCRLSRATVEVYSHCDMAELAKLLSKDAIARRRLIVTESVFSMDGDQAPLVEIATLARQHQSMWMVDEAHATGVLGPSGRGLTAELGLTPTIQMGTLGKALGVSGGYVAASRPVIDWLLNRARTFVFTTATPPAIAVAASRALHLAAGDEGKRRRADLAFHVETFHAGLAQIKLAPARPSHIVPLLVGDAQAALNASESLFEAGVFAHAIRPPTVPEGTARLRLSLMATHTSEHIRQALAAIRAHRGFFGYCE